MKNRNPDATSSPRRSNDDILAWVNPPPSVNPRVAGQRDADKVLAMHGDRLREIVSKLTHGA